MTFMSFFMFVLQIIKYHFSVIRYLLPSPDNRRVNIENANKNGLHNERYDRRSAPENRRLITATDDLASIA